MKKNVDTITAELYTAAASAFNEIYTNSVINHSAKPITPAAIARFNAWTIEDKELRRDLEFIANKEATGPLCNWDKQIKSEKTRRRRDIARNIKNCGFVVMVEESKSLPLIEGYNCDILSLPRIYNELCKMVDEKAATIPPAEQDTTTDGQNTTTDPETATAALLEAYTATPCTFGRCHNTKYTQRVTVASPWGSVRFLYNGGRCGAFDEVKKQFPALSKIGAMATIYISTLQQQKTASKAQKSTAPKSWPPLNSSTPPHSLAPQSNGTSKKPLSPPSPSPFPPSAHLTPHQPPRPSQNPIHPATPPPHLKPNTPNTLYCIASVTSTKPLTTTPAQ